MGSLALVVAVYAGGIRDSIVELARIRILVTILRIIRTSADDSHIALATAIGMAMTEGLRPCGIGT